MIEFFGIDKAFRDGSGGVVTALNGFELAVSTGETHCLIGTSGCGKTTALRLINRLEVPDRGEVLVGGESVADQDPIALRRRIGYVIQSGGLFPHMTVAANVGILGVLDGWSADAVEGRVGELLQLVGLPASEFGARYPAELSGGQRQRVGVARALMLDPAYLLLDEPFGALDPITRRRVHADLAPVFQSMSKTLLLVTHDLDEAFLLADRISIMDRGRVVQTGTPQDLVECPADPFVAEFVAPARRDS